MIKEKKLKGRRRHGSEMIMPNLYGRTSSYGRKRNLGYSKRQSYFRGIELYVVQLYRADQLYRHPRYAFGQQ